MSPPSTARARGRRRQSLKREAGFELSSSLFSQVRRPDVGCPELLSLDPLATVVSPDPILVVGIAPFR
jgi:hypothetical protein